MTVLDAAAAERGKLRRVLGRMDTVFFLISAMVVVDTIGAIAVGGGETFTWLVVLFATFFIPSALASAELGAAIPEEGGAYVWVRRAFGRYAGALTSLLYWAGTPMWLGGSVAVVAMAVYQQFLGGLSLAGLYLFGTVFIAVATAGAVIPLRFGKWIPTSGAVGQIVLLTFFTVSVALYGARHGVHGISVGDLAPSRAVFIAIVPILLYSFTGTELPSTAGEEMVNPRRDIQAAIAREGIGQALMYGIPILAVLIVLPAGQITSLNGLIDALQAVLTSYGGSVAADGTVTLTGWGQLLGWACAITFIWVLAASGAAWIMGARLARVRRCQPGVYASLGRGQTRAVSLRNRHTAPAVKMASQATALTPHHTSIAPPVSGQCTSWLTPYSGVNLASTCRACGYWLSGTNRPPPKASRIMMKPMNCMTFSVGSR